MLDVVVTFMGRFIAQSIPRTFNAPEPIPSSPDTNPAKKHYYFSLMIQFFISVIISIVLISLLYYNSKRKEWVKVNEKSRR